MKKTIWLMLCVLSCVVGLAACNTVEGLGKDIKTAGEKMESAAKK